MDFPKKQKVGSVLSRSENLVAKLVETPSKISTYTFISPVHKPFSELTSPLSKGKCCRDIVLFFLWNSSMLFWKQNIVWTKSPQSCPSLVDACGWFMTSVRNIRPCFDSMTPSCSQVLPFPSKNVPDRFKEIHKHIENLLKYCCYEGKHGGGDWFDAIFVFALMHNNAVNFVIGSDGASVWKFYALSWNGTNTTDFAKDLGPRL